jgi:succinyl-CoA synthetase beta subunit
MKIHEYQAKELLSKYGAPTLFGRVVFSSYEAGKIAQEEFVDAGKNVIVIKSQVHAGGRGKGIIKDPDSGEVKKLFDKEVRGVNIVSGENPADIVHKYAEAMLGNKLVTIQTGEGGAIVQRLLLEEACAIKRELYLGIALDRAAGRNVVMASAEGGMEIEKIAAETPEKIFKEAIDPAVGFSPYQARHLAFALGLEGAALKNFTEFVSLLVKAYEDLDCSLVEINPLALLDDDRIIALDAKITIDDNALFRHPELLELRDFDEESPLEVEASKYDLNYIKLDGNVGCMVNGAGLAMATMDMIQQSGGSPANFLDVGGGANPHRIANAFRIMLSDPNVKAVLINIFGGIVRCDKVADGILQALKSIKVELPVIIRLDGANADEGIAALKSSGMEFKLAKTIAEAAKLVSESLK